MNNTSSFFLMLYVLFLSSSSSSSSQAQASYSLVLHLTCTVVNCLYFYFALCHVTASNQSNESNESINSTHSVHEWHASTGMFFCDLIYYNLQYSMGISKSWIQSFFLTKMYLITVLNVTASKTTKTNSQNCRRVSIQQNS